MYRFLDMSMIFVYRDKIFTVIFIIMAGIESRHDLNTSIYEMS